MVRLPIKRVKGRGVRLPVRRPVAREYAPVGMDDVPEGWAGVGWKGDRGPWHYFLGANALCGLSLAHVPGRLELDDGRTHEDDCKSCLAAVVDRRAALSLERRARAAGQRTADDAGGPRA